MTTKSRSRTASVLIAGTTALALGAAGLAAAVPAQAASETTTTLGILGAPVNHAGTSWYNDGTVVPVRPPADPGPARDVTLTVKQVGADVKATVEVSGGPNTSQFAGAGAGTYQLDAFVRMDGAADTRGKHFEGPKGTVDVAANAATFASGAKITGIFKNVKPGSHTFTLSDLFMDSKGPSSGGFMDAPTGFDTFYNAGTTPETIADSPTDWDLSESLTVVDETGPKVSLTKPNKAAKVASWKTLKGKSSDVSGVKSVSVKLTEKRGKESYYYTGTKWKKASSAKKAKSSAKSVKASLKNSGNWSVKVADLKAGKLTIRYWGVDDLKNKSSVKNYTTKKLS